MANKTGINIVGPAISMFGDLLSSYNSSLKSGADEVKAHIAYLLNTENLDLDSEEAVKALKAVNATYDQLVAMSGKAVTEVLRIGQAHGITRRKADMTFEQADAALAKALTELKAQRG